jgi:hypothetical protein
MHMRVIDVWLNTPLAKREEPEGVSWLDSYDKTLINFPAPLTC